MYQVSCCVSILDYVQLTAISVFLFVVGEDNIDRVICYVYKVNSSEIV